MSASELYTIGAGSRYDIATFLYDGSMAGLLTVIFEVYERRLADVSISHRDKTIPDVFARQIDIGTDERKARRVWDGLGKKVSAQALEAFCHCHLSELPGVENTLLAYAQYAFAANHRIEDDFGDEAVLAVSQIARKVWREKHRMEAFVRFQLLQGDLYFATIAPDYDVLPIIHTHFSKRYADQEWLIYDTIRKYGIYYTRVTGHLSKVIFEGTQVENNGGLNFDPAEQQYQLLWKDYFKHTGIPERKNNQLHLRHMPLRYWKYLVEKQL